jgi:hypothetical protein
MKTMKTLPLCIRLLPVVPAGGLVVLGIWIAGGVITNDFRASMGLTALWLVLSLTAAALVVRRWRSLAAPVLIAVLGTWGVAGGYLAWTTLRGTTVHERIALPGDGNVLLAAGSFTSGEHTTTGRAVIIRLASGRRVLTLDLRTSPGPDLRVYLVPGDGGDVSDHRDLGGLKGNRGTQQYDVPADAALARYSAVVVYCRAFSAPFGAAVLRIAA